MTESITTAGKSCPAGHFACVEELARCPRCGQALNRAADLQEWAVERALDTDATIEAVHGEAATALAQGDAIGALLRY